MKSDLDHLMEATQEMIDLGMFDNKMSSLFQIWTHKALVLKGNYERDQAHLNAIEKATMDAVKAINRED